MKELIARMNNTKEILDRLARCSNPIANLLSSALLISYVCMKDSFKHPLYIKKIFDDKWLLNKTGLFNDAYEKATKFLNK